MNEYRKVFRKYVRRSMNECNENQRRKKNTNNNDFVMAHQRQKSTWSTNHWLIRWKLLLFLYRNVIYIASDWSFALSLTKHTHTFWHRHVRQPFIGVQINVVSTTIFVFSIDTMHCILIAEANENVKIYGISACFNELLKWMGEWTLHFMNAHDDWYRSAAVKSIGSQSKGTCNSLKRNELCIVESESDVLCIRNVLINDLAQSQLSRWRY